MNVNNVGSFYKIYDFTGHETSETNLVFQDLQTDGLKENDMKIKEVFHKEPNQKIGT